jgi:hypothetical protein
VHVARYALWRHVAQCPCDAAGGAGEGAGGFDATVEVGGVSYLYVCI